MDIDITKYKRNRDKIFKSVMFKKETVIAKEDLFIIFPKRFIDLGLGVIDNTITVYGVVGMLNSKNEYAVWVIPTMVDITPDSIELVTINDEEYYLLTILKDDPIFDSLNVVVMPDLGFETFNVLLVKGYIPWYIGYEDMLSIFKAIPKYTGSKIQQFFTAVKVMIATSARDAENPNIPYRKSIRSKTDLTNRPILWAGLNNVYYTFNSTASKIFGSYMKAGMVSAIINPEKKSTKLENIIRR